MYSRLNESIDLVCSNIDPTTDIKPYIRLTRAIWNIDVSADNDFQSSYRKYWQLNAARLGSTFVGAYFSYFEKLKQESKIELKRVAQDLFEVPTHGDGRQSLQFSFASKMVHMLRPQFPVYDSTVEAFFFLPLGSQSESTERKLDRLLESHRFLKWEYDRVLNEGLLRPAITAFRGRFSLGPEYTDQKIIDTLIWKFVSVLRSGAIRDGAIVYR
jgi:hypothetical protein